MAAFVPKKLDCCGCLRLLNDPSILECGHIYCLPCAKNLQPSKCLSDGIRFVDNDLSVNDKLRGLIEDLRNANLLSDRGTANFLIL